MYKNKRILIIENDPVHRRLIESALRQRYELDLTEDSESALERLRGSISFAYDLVIVNLRLPAKVGKPASTEEGFRILQFLQDCLCPSVLVFGGHLGDRTRKHIEALGVKQIFEKPFSMKIFRASIDVLLSKAEGKKTKR
jgi:DNA-binding response OmpR family regulator